MREIVCKKNDIDPGKMKSATLGPIPIVVCRTQDGEYYAFANKCLHQGAPLSKGLLCGAAAPTAIHGEYQYEKEGEILRCPWHGREYDIKNGGCMLVNPKRRLRSFQVSIEDDNVVVSK